MRDVLLVAVTLIASLTAPPLIALVKARQKPRVANARLRRAVLVEMKSGASFEGVLFEADRDAIVLRNTLIHVPGEQSRPVDGELLILTGDVLFVQFL